VASQCTDGSREHRRSSRACRSRVEGTEYAVAEWRGARSESIGAAPEYCADTDAAPMQNAASYSGAVSAQHQNTDAAVYPAPMRILHRGSQRRSDTVQRHRSRYSSAGGRAEGRKRAADAPRRRRAAARRPRAAAASATPLPPRRHPRACASRRPRGVSPGDGPGDGDGPGRSRGVSGTVDAGERHRGLRYGGGPGPGRMSECGWAATGPAGGWAAARCWAQYTGTRPSRG
jgi:hypothetical protein